jgi:hypothetical protein
MAESQRRETVSDTPQGVGRSLTFYNQHRLHRALRALDGRTPDRVSWKHQPARPTAVKASTARHHV